MQRVPGKIIVTLGVATLVAIASLAMISVSFATNYWTETEVDREAIEDLGFFNGTLEYEDHYLFDRYRGLFRTCYEPAEDAKFLDEWTDVVDGNCQFELGYELSGRDEADDWGDDYEDRIHLLRCHWIFFVIAILLALTACVLGLVGCWSIRIRIYAAAGFSVCGAAFFTLMGMIMFHVYYDLENNDITAKEAGFPAYLEAAPSTDIYLTTIRKNSDTNYGYSYTLGWCAFAACLMAAILFWAASSALRNAMRLAQAPPLMEFAQPPAMSQAHSYMKPATMPTPMSTNGGMVPVVPVGPPVVPVVPVTDIYDYAASRAGTRTPYAQSEAPSHYTLPAITKYESY